VEPLGPASRSVAARAPIRRLDEQTVHEIAAGEVIERPASVAKELVENSIDAGAREIRVRWAEGGLALVEVADDGLGIPAGELRVAFDRHATSKLREARELPGVRTLGFRGEALAAIAAVARVRVTTRVPEASEAVEASVEAGAFEGPRPAARALGTTMEVRDLFFHTPARRKFLRSAQTESLRITEMLESLYLAHPEVTFHLAPEGREEQLLPSTDSLREAAARVFGTPFLASAFEFSGAAGPGLWARGVASHPSFSRGTPRGIVVVVDGRVIQSKGVTDAVRFAYREVLPQGRYPVVLLHLATEPGRVDVNVHPTKREVRFEKESELRDALHGLIRARLQDQPREIEPGGLGARDPLARTRPSLAAADAETFPITALSGIVRQYRLEPRAAPPASASGSAPTPGEKGRTTTLASEGEPLRVPSTAVHPALRLLGQVGALYLVAEEEGSSGTLVLIDAHAASERVLYERLRSQEPPARQELLVPVELELTPRQKRALEAFGSELERAGFSVEAFGPGAYRLRAVPFFRGHRARPEAVARLLDELADGGRSAPGDPLREKVAKSAACHMAIRGGDALSPAEMTRLLSELYACPESFTCPHGRPIMVAFPRDRLDRWFLRP
jgi:DNA mismatch repair protein MutL